MFRCQKVSEDRLLAMTGFQLLHGLADSVQNVALQHFNYSEMRIRDRRQMTSAVRVNTIAVSTSHWLDG